MWQPDLSTLQNPDEYFRFERTNHYDVQLNLPSTKLADALSVHNPQLDSTHKAYVQLMMQNAFYDSEFHPYEGDKDELNLNFNKLQVGYEYMMSWAGTDYDTQFRALMNKGNAEGLDALAIMYRRDQMAQAVNKLFMYSSNMSYYRETEAMFGGEIDEEAQGILDSVREGVDQAASAITPENLEFFRFKNLDEVETFFKNFETFISHPDIDTLIEAYAKYALGVETKRFEKQGRTLDTRVVNLKHYRSVAKNGLMSYTLLSRAVYGAEVGDYKGRTLAKLGIMDEAIVEGVTINAFPELTVPDSFDIHYSDTNQTLDVNDFLNNPLLPREDYKKIILNMFKHTSNWNVWFK